MDDRETLLAPTAPSTLRPAQICGQLLAAMDGSEGRRKKRKRNTTPDAIGMGIKRDLLTRVTVDDPEQEDFEAWLLHQCLTAGPLTGATRAMAMDILDEWRLALASEEFRAWLDEGAPSDDVES
ncbi:MAG: hypothetical protein M3R02_00975 [Chloroflexota bacterium]|nr:hypothetical protein [Chloroflexota bacterium]